MKILVTGAAGFIGSQVSELLCKLSHEVIGIDNLNEYYDVNLKKTRLKNLSSYPQFSFVKLDLINGDDIHALFEKSNFTVVIHLAAQAGVRYSLDNPMAYIESNLVGHLSILEACRHHHIKHLLYASSSSVYGLNKKLPFSCDDSVDHPISLYAATKKSNELMSHSYSHLYGIPTTGLRFFTVYGPWGRPDMALFKFTKGILNGEPIDIYNQGNMSRDFTYISDIVNGICQLIEYAPIANKEWHVEAGMPSSSSAPYRVVNIGNGNPVKLMDFIEEIEKQLGIKAIKNYLPMQMGDVAATWANTADLYQITGYQPKVDVAEGIMHFVKWYREYYQC